MNTMNIAFKYLKKYPALTIATLASIIVESFFEGASFGMLIPLIQGMTNTGSNVFAKMRFFQQFGDFFALTDQRSLLSFVFIALFFIVIIKNAFLYLSNILMTKFRFTFSRDRSAELMDNLVDYDLSYFDSINSGHLISVITTETRRMGDFVLAVLSFAALFVRVAAYVVLLFFISWKASVLIFILIATVLIPLEFIMKKLKKFGMLVSQAFSEHSTKLTEIINGIRLIKESATEEAEKASFKKVADKVCESQFKVNQHTYLFIPVSESMIFMLIMGGCMILINVAKINMTMGFPFIATYLVVLVKALTQLNTMNSTRSNAMSNLASFSVYEALMEKRGKKHIESGNRAIAKLSDSITFEDVTFSYRAGIDILKGVTIAVPAGKLTAIVGASGAGKSTIVNLIMRFYDIQKGHIRIDGIDLRELDLSGWRRMIGFVSQDVFIFNASVMDNIRYGHPLAPAEAVAKAALAAGVDDFVHALPHGYDTILGERGVRLSGGQKQRISIARAILSNPEILILDEATSSLDTDTERSIKAAIDRLTRNRTVIAIAHRLSTIVNADNIVVLENGTVAESGSHADLVKRDGLYKHFYDIQFNIKGICGEEVADYA